MTGSPPFPSDFRKGGRIDSSGARQDRPSLRPESSRRQEQNRFENPFGVLLQYWYSFFPLENDFDFVTSINPQDRFFFAKTDKKTIINQRLIGFKIKGSHDPDLLHALLNSSFQMLITEMLGGGRGDGVLDLNGTKFKSAMFLNASLLTPESCLEIKKAFAALKKRKMENIDIELSKADRIRFEDVLYEAFGIDKETQSRIQSTLLQMHEVRLNGKK